MMPGLYILDIFVKICPYLETSIGIPCILLNIYLAMRFTEVKSLNSNFRSLMVRQIQKKNKRKFAIDRFLTDFVKKIFLQKMRKFFWVQNITNFIFMPNARATNAFKKFFLKTPLF